mgnify:CR=1 FL=1
METEPADLTPSQAARLIAAMRRRKDFDPDLRRHLAILWHQARVRERKTCPVCGAEFEGLVRAKYCGRQCARQAARVRARDNYLRKKAGGAGTEAG